MRYVLYPCIGALLLLASCAKNRHAPGDDNGCMNFSTIDDTHPYRLTEADSVYAMSLITTTTLPYHDMRLLRVIYDTIGARTYVLARTQQYINNLPVFTSTVDVEFINGALQPLPGNIIGTTMDAKPALPLSKVRWLYFNKLQDASEYSQFKSPQDSCLTAIFGYYDLNAGTGNKTLKLTKAWVVHPPHSGYPLAIINDNGDVISFDDGMRYYSL